MLDAAGLRSTDVDTFVTVSSTGIAPPSVEARAAREVGYLSDLERVRVFRLGRAGGVTSLSIAPRLAEAWPGSVVLVVAIELYTLSFRLDGSTNANIVATALVGDGAAACVLRIVKSRIAEIEMSGHLSWPDMPDTLGWSVDSLGLGVIFGSATIDASRS